MEFGALERGRGCELVCGGREKNSREEGAARGRERGHYVVVLSQLWEVERRIVVDDEPKLESDRWLRW